MHAVRSLARSLRAPRIHCYTLAVSLLAGCSNQSGESGTGGAGGRISGGTTNASGAAALAGAPATSGGSTASGGSVAQGGVVATNSGGANASGGVVAAGGAPTAGSNAAGASNSAGSSALAGSGGVAGAGGTSGGGATALGGAAGSGGATVTGGTAGSSGGNTAGGKGGAPGTGGGAATGGVNAAGAGGAGGAPSGSYRPCPTNGAVCKIMPFGDSITDGFGTAGAYRVELFRLAHQAGKNITFVGTGSNSPGMVDGVAFPPNHEGHSGFTIDTTPSRSGIAPLVATVMPQFTPHIVLLMIGTNDAIDNYQLANAPARLGVLIDDIFARLPSALVVVAQPVPSQEDPLNARIQSYNAAIPAIVKARADAGKHILLVDMYTPFAAVASYKTSLLKDTWHPNEAGHVILGARWYSVLANSL